MEEIVPKEAEEREHLETDEEGIERIVTQLPRVLSTLIVTAKLILIDSDNRSFATYNVTQRERERERERRESVNRLVRGY